MSTSPARNASRSTVVTAAAVIVGVAAVAAIALSVASTWPGRIGVAVALLAAVAGVVLMARALRAQSEAHMAELREQARRAHDALREQHQREREALAVIDARTTMLHGTIGSLKERLRQQADAHFVALDQLEASEKQVKALDEHVRELSADLAVAEAENTELGQELLSRTSELAAALDRVAELEGMVAIYEAELTAQSDAEVFGLPRRTA